MSCETHDRREFRCCIPAENSAGKLRVDGKQYDVNVLDTSRNGFCIKVSNKVAAKVREKSAIVLSYNGELWEVALKSRYSECGGFTNLGISRIREISKIKPPRSWGISIVPSPGLHNDPTFLAFLIFAFLVATICLPGVGDNLGTAPKVQKAVRSILKSTN